MRSSFGSLNTAVLGLAAQQLAVDTTGHNIANANTPGFSRQDAVMQAADPFTTPTFNRSPTAGQLGTGVQVTTIRRMRDAFLDTQIRQQTASMGEQQITRDAIEQIEVVFNEPAASGLAAMMSRFFNSWQALANRPEDAAVRAALVEEAGNFTAMIQRNSAQLVQIRVDLNEQIRLKTEEVNSLAGRIAEINAQISQVQGVGQQPNNLRDQRDLLVDQLSKLTNVSAVENPNGSINLFISSRALVLGNDAMLLTNGLDAGGDTTVLWQGDNASVSLNSGEIRGLATVRDTTLQAQQASLDALAAAIIGQVNAIHSTGYGPNDAAAPNRAFFTGVDATTIAIDPAVAADPGLVATAAAAGQPGDNSKALAIAKLRDDLTMSGGTATFHTYYQSVTASLGTTARKAATGAENQRLLVDMLTRRKQSVAGVNLDEEATNLLQYQHAYQAASRVVTAVDEMLDQIINRMGRVGL